MIQGSLLNLDVAISPRKPNRQRGRFMIDEKLQAWAKSYSKLTDYKYTPEQAIEYCKRVATNTCGDPAQIARNMTRGEINRRMKWPHDPELLHALFKYVAEKHDQHDCDRTLLWTERFLEDETDLTRAEIGICINFFNGKGAFCDCQMINNAKRAIYGEEGDKEPGQ
jgi:hypothetical protein